MAAKPKPQLPTGNSSMLAGVSENMSFHSSPESFLVNRIIQHHKDYPNEVRQRAAVQAKILNRNVIVVSSYHQIQQVLNAAESEGEEPVYMATAAYRQLMDAFFPPPNLLLNDGCPHRQMRQTWAAAEKAQNDHTILDRLHSSLDESIKRLPMGKPIDLYDWCKTVGWSLFMSLFLEMSDSDADFEHIVQLQEDLLRGQFSLFPVRVNVGLWHSRRKKGIDSRKELQKIFARRLRSSKPSWLPDDAVEEVIVNHLLMATSSLAVKGFASLILALLLNLYFRKEIPGSEQTLASWITAEAGDARQRRVHAVLQETLRLSPPIVGVMRRATRETTLSTQADDEPDVLVPKGYETWCYFPGANRDPAVFGDEADIFMQERYIQDDAKPPLAFGAGSKTCLGATVVQRAAVLLIGAFLDNGICLQGRVEAAGVRGWLGWDIASPGLWARDVKQLPTQRPSKPIMVRFEKEDRA